jgi:hypothetical protein
MQKNQIKLFAVLVTILALGFILGAVSVQFIVENRISRMGEMRHESRFVHEFSRIIGSTGSQPEEVDAILRKYHQEFMKAREGHQVEHEKMMKAMQKDLTPFLTKDQLEQFQHSVINPPPRNRPPRNRPRPDNRPPRNRPHPEDMRRGTGDRPPQRPPIPFEKIDANGDGVISGQESTDYIGIDSSDDPRFIRLDRNNDGKLDKEEYFQKNN